MFAARRETAVRCRQHCLATGCHRARGPWWEERAVKVIMSVIDEMMLW